MKTTQILFVVSLIIGLIVACTTTPPQPAQSPIGRSPIAQPAVSSSPLPVSTAVRFQIERPVIAGVNVIRGTGPAGVPIYISDVTFMGEPLGTGTIGSDGKFAITVQPLEAKHRIGLALGILDGTTWKPDDFYKPEFYGPDAMQVPQVSFFHDTVMVGE